MAEFDLHWERLPLATVHQLDALCDRFEQALGEDANTRIEPYIAGIDQHLQRLVLPELVRLEIEARGQERVEAEEYVQRFPQWDDELREIVPHALVETRAASIATFASAETIDLSRRADNDTKKQFPDSAASTGEAPQANPAAELHSSLGTLRHWLPADGVLGHYQIRQVIGRGGMGVVVRAHDTKLTRDVAIKFPDPRIVQDPTAKERFLREARAAAVVRHNNTVTIYAVEEINQVPFLAMELVEGITLEAYLRDSGKPVGEVVSIAHQTAQALAVAHKQGLIHRDIKPANILLEKNEQHERGPRTLSPWHVKTTDFGLARAIGTAGLTQSGLIAGTPQYMSPEQVEGKHLDARTDLFSLGSVMYAMCVGRAPFEADSAVAILRQVADKSPLPLREVAPETPDWLIAIIEKLMAKSPDDRFASAAELTELLGHHLHDLQGRSSATDTVVESIAAGNRTSWLAAIGGGLLLLAAIVFFALPARDVDVPANGKLSVQKQPPNVPTSDSEQLGANSIAGEGPGWHVDAPPPAIAPFDADQARAHQEAWAKYLGVPVQHTNSIGMQFMLIPPGEFTMGSTMTEIAEALPFAYGEQWAVFMKSEAPQHQVVLTKPLYMGKNEVTQAQYQRVMNNNPSRFAATGKGQEAVAGLDTSDFPVEMVSWNDAAEFCTRLSSLDEPTSGYVRADESVTLQEGTGYRLPTEAQWEFSCRAGTTTRFWSGDQDDDLPFKFTTRRTHPVGQYRANPFALHDFHGNAWEWVRDGFSPTAYLDVADQGAIDPFTPGKNGAKKITRGGNWGNSPALCRASMRSACQATDDYNGVGFRVSLSVDAVSQSLQQKQSGGVPKRIETSPWGQKVERAF